LEAFVSVGAWDSIEDIENKISLPELINIIDTVRFNRHSDYDVLAQLIGGESIGEYESMTDRIPGERTASSADMALDSEFTISHLPIGLGYESE
tara:strand:+ start:2560 stop:2841 length:282 start_codon:yes stop_codon:yes gene_type:complete